MKFILILIIQSGSNYALTTVPQPYTVQQMCMIAGEEWKKIESDFHQKTYVCLPVS